MPPRSKYAPLTDFLRAQPPETERVTLAFGAIEALIRSSLPLSAYTTGRHWWSNAPSISHTRAWRSAGWAVVAARRGRSGGARQWVATFTRVRSETTAAPRAPDRP